MALASPAPRVLADLAARTWISQVALVVGGAASVVLSAVTENRSFFLFLIPAVLGMVAAYWNSINRGYNFTAAISPDGIRLRYGLLDTQAQTLPPGVYVGMNGQVFAWDNVTKNRAAGVCQPL